MAALVAACLVLGVWYATFHGKPNRKKALCVKSAASLMFVILAIVCLAVKSSSYGAVILFALIAGAIADVLLGMRFITAHYKQRFFLAGAAVFALGHIGYIVAINLLGKVDLVYYILGAALGIALCGIPMLLKKVHYGKLRIPLFGYAIILGMMLMSAVSYAVSSGAGWQAVLVAAVLFAISDFVLLLMLFVKSDMPGSIVNLSTYYAAQSLFALTIIWCA